MNAYERACNKINRYNCSPCNKSLIALGPTGPTGPQGIPGPTGPVPDFAIGQVVTGAPGSQAIVTIRQVF